jgi:hypothetical protein
MTARRRRKEREREANAPNRFRLQHGGIVRRVRSRDDPIGAAYTDNSESPLAWLARRRDRDGRPFIDPAQLLAGERLRTDFTQAGLTPRVTANWISPVTQGRRTVAGDAGGVVDLVLAARERLARTLDAVGPEFSGLLLDVCCFLKGLETVERERHWPPRAARIVLALALDRLARHYGISTEARGPARVRIRAWQGDGARPTMNGS